MAYEENLRSVRCNDEKLQKLISTNNRIIVVSECSLAPGFFESLPTSNFSIFISQKENPLLRNNTFLGVCSLLIINLSKNGITIIEPGSFRCLSNLSSLYLSNNEIGHLPDAVFKDLVSLRNLDLSRNRIQVLSEEAFQDLSSVTELKLGQNDIKHFRGSPFKSITSLHRLDLSENPELPLTKDMFETLHELGELSLDGCNLTSIPDDAFEKNEKLWDLRLGHNHLRVLTKSHFRSLKRLRYLTVSTNEISELGHETFEQNAELLSLDLSHNKLSRVESFSGVYSLKKLMMLDISQNSILEIGNFERLKELKILNISHNELSDLPGPDTFENNTELVKLDISYNHLTDFKNVRWQDMSKLNNLVISENAITRLLIPEVMHNINIHLERNKIHSIYVSQENSINNGYYIKLKIHLSGNPLVCDCNIYELYSLLNGKDSLQRVDFVDGLTCKLPQKHSGKKLSAMNSSDFQCSSCPEGCSCEFKVYDFIENKINCSNLNYDFIPIVTSPNASILHINQNNLKHLAGTNDSCWENLTELYAESNQIVSEDIYIPRTLRFLGLKSNNLTILPESAERYANVTKDFKMTLSNNLWQCSCALLPFKRFVSSHSSQVADIEDVRCIYPNNSLTAEALITTKDSEICPYLDYILLDGYLTAVCISVLSLTLMSILVYYFTHRTHIAAFLYTHCNSCYMLCCCDKPNEEDKLYDCFISYSSLDFEVTWDIVEELEKKPPHYKFCVHERNWSPGEYITNNIVSSVQNSRKTLIVLSKDFLQSPWFHLEFQAAYSQTLADKKNRLLFVLKGELPDKSALESDLQFVLSTVTYLQWGERWFWEKLKYALHEEKPFLGFQRKFGFLQVCSCAWEDNVYRTDDESGTVQQNEHIV